MQKKLHLIFLTILILIFGCSGNDKPGKTAKNEQAKPEVTEVTFWHAMGGPLGKVLDKLIAEFNQATADIHINAVGMGRYYALNQKMMAAIAAGQPPTMAQAFEAWTIQFQESEALVPMSHFIEGSNGLDQASFDDLLPVFVEGNTWQGQMWSFPFNKSVRALYYNKDMFREVGLNPEKPPSNWEEYYSFAEKLSRDIDGDGDTDVFGTASQISAWMFENLLLQNEGRLLNEEKTDVMYNSQEGIEALEFLVKLLGRDSKVGHITNGFEYQNEFLADNVGMIEGSTVTSAYIAGKHEFELGIAPIPSHKKKACIVSGTNIIIFSKAEKSQQNAAWRFIKWFTSPEITARWAAGTGYVPVRQSAFETETIRQYFEKNPGLKEVFDQLNYAYYEPVSSAWYAGRKYLEENAIQAALKGIENPKKALDKAAQDTKEELTRLEN